MIGDIIKAHRKAMNMSKRELAQKLSVHESLISKYEKTEVDLPLSKFKQISKILNINPLELLDCENNSNNNNININDNLGKIRDITYNNTTNNSGCCENLNPAEQNIDDTIALQQQDKLLQTEILLLLKELSVTSKEILITLKEIKNYMNK
mgnify:CR=1 FL=1